MIQRWWCGLCEATEVVFDRQGVAFDRYSQHHRHTHGDQVSLDGTISTIRADDSHGGVCSALPSSTIVSIHPEAMTCFLAEGHSGLHESRTGPDHASYAQWPNMLPEGTTPPPPAIPRGQKMIPRPQRAIEA